MREKSAYSQILRASSVNFPPPFAEFSGFVPKTAPNTGENRPSPPFHVKKIEKNAKKPFNFARKCPDGEIFWL